MSGLALIIVSANVYNVLIYVQIGAIMSATMHERNPTSGGYCLC